MNCWNPGKTGSFKYNHQYNVTKVMQVYLNLTFKRTMQKPGERLSQTGFDCFVIEIGQYEKYWVSITIEVISTLKSFL